MFLIILLFCMASCCHADLDRTHRALDAAKSCHTNPILSHFHVRSATIVEHQGEEHLFTSGNCEYCYPEALHSESALVAQVISKLGAKVAKEKITFIAFDGSPLSPIFPCGDCRDFLIASTNWQELKIVAGNSDHELTCIPFTECLYEEESFPLMTNCPVTKEELTLLCNAADNARKNGLNFLTPEAYYTAAAGLTPSGRLISSCGTSDGAFHYRTAVGGVLQQVVSSGERQLKAVVVVGEKGVWPKVSYRERQYGHEFSGLAEALGHSSLPLILSNGEGSFRITTFKPRFCEKLLPQAILRA